MLLKPFYFVIYLHFEVLYISKNMPVRHVCYLINIIDYRDAINTNDKQRAGM